MTESEIPTNVLKVIEKLDPADQAIIQSYISDLKKSGDGDEEDKGAPMNIDEEIPGTEEAAEDKQVSDEPDFPPLYTSGEDFDKASEFKMEASELKSAGKWEEALEKYTQAILVARPSALLYANRAMSLLKLNRPEAAERDCNEALKENPDSAKALRIRGKARKDLEKWEDALHDLSSSQAIDFDEGTVDDLKFLTEKHLELEKEVAQKRIDQEEKLRKRAEEIRAAQEEAKREAEEEKARSAASAGMGGMPGMGGMGGMPGMGGMGGMPGMGGMGGMPGMGGGGMGGMMAGLMKDPEIAEAMKNPKVMAAFQELLGAPGGVMGLMSNPGKLQEMMADPEIGPVMQKLMAKLGGGMGMGGMPGMGGMGGMGGGAPGGQKGGADDIPDMGDIPDLD